MTIQEILAKLAADRSEEEKTFLTDHAAELTTEQTEQIEAESKADEQDESNESIKTDKGDGDDESGNDDNEGDVAVAKDSGEVAAEKGEAGEQVVSASEDALVTITASELKKFKQYEADLIQAHQAAKQTAVNAEVLGLIKGSDGMSRITSKQKEAVTTFLMNADDKTAEAFRTIMNGLPGIKIAGEIGASEDTENVQKKATDTLEAYKKTGMSELAAQDKLEKDEPDLYKQLKEEV